MLTPLQYKNIRNVVITGEGHGLLTSLNASLAFEQCIYKPIHFQVKELVSPSVYAQRGESALELLDSRIVWTFDALREYFNVPMIINNGKDYTQCGFRNDSEVGAVYSQHRYGRAGDLHCKLNYDTMRKEIIAKWKTEQAFRFITAIELNVNWLHIDCRNTNRQELFTFTK
jgi:hypothetical protein